MYRVTARVYVVPGTYFYVNVLRCLKPYFLHLETEPHSWRPGSKITGMSADCFRRRDDQQN